MALVEYDECDADQWEQEEDAEAYMARTPEKKYVFNDRQITITAGGTTDQERGWVCTFANTGLVGVADYYDAVSLGKPVIGNFIRGKRFDWKMLMTSPMKFPPNNNMVRNMITFRLLFLLVWEFPADIVLGTTQFLRYYLENSFGNRHASFLYPDVKEKVVVLYDCNHTVGSDGNPNVWGQPNVSAAAGGQAGYVVGPADPGYVVPAATVPAITTTQGFQINQRFGGHQLALSGSFDLSGYEMALWKDPSEVEENQIVPCIMCFVVCQDLYHYSPSGSFGTVGDRPTTTWQFFTRLAFTDE